MATSSPTWLEDEFAHLAHLISYEEPHQDDLSHLAQLLSLREPVAEPFSSTLQDVSSIDEKVCTPSAPFWSREISENTTAIEEPIQDHDTMVLKEERAHVETPQVEPRSVRPAAMQSRRAQANPTSTSSFASTRGSFRTAQSSVASWSTAPIVPDETWRLRNTLIQRSTANTFDRTVWDDRKDQEFDLLRSKWMDHLRARGMILGPMEALDWSGQGQHVEYSHVEEPRLPLITLGVLGSGASGIVDKVRCRRIDLARKTIKCTRQLTREEAVTEVEHLQKLQHRHIVRLVGTYVWRRHLAILMYPVAEQSLEDFLYTVLNDDVKSSVSAAPRKSRTLFGIIACLTNAVAFIHEHKVKHMDIKPTNILVTHSKRNDLARVYIADFGIARSYSSLEESFTDTPISFTRTYTALEVAQQDIRGPPADIFSLGCVFMEIVSALISTPRLDHRDRLLKARGQGNDRSYQANTDAVLEWYDTVLKTVLVLVWDHAVKAEGHIRAAQIQWPSSISAMLTKELGDRPSAAELKDRVSWLSCGCCNAGPEPFEAAERVQFQPIPQHI